MSDSGTMSDNGTYPAYSDREQVIQHDLRHALFTLRTGIALLEQVREDPEKFSEVKHLLDHEIANASDLVNELLRRPDLLPD
jgi:signal transduction histidine kinase